jgi:hypothetical protein
MPRFRKTVAIDFDGVIHKHVSKWTVAHEIHDGPVDGAFAFIEEVLLFYDVSIFSARAVDPEGHRAITLWLMKHWQESGRDMKVLSPVVITGLKPHAFIYIDDRGWRFEGKFPTLEELRAFEPWQKKLKKEE